MKRSVIYASALAAVLTFGFASCGSDDEEFPGEGGEKSGATAVNPENVFTHGLPVQVGDIVITRNEKGLVTKIVDDGDVTTFDYTPANSRVTVNIPADYDMTMNTDWGNDKDGIDFYFKLNGQGFIEYAYEVDEDEYDGTSVNEWWFKYDSAGRMIEMKRTEGNNEITSVTYNEDGDITDVKVSDDDAIKGKMHCTITYVDDTHATPISNKSGIMLYDDSFRIDMDEMAPAYFAGLLGKGTAHLPLGAVETNLVEEGYKDIYTFTWVLNASQMPVKFTASYKYYTPWTEGEPSTYEDEPIEIKW